jgi:hypothetical protein
VSDINYVAGLNQAWKARREYPAANRKGKAAIVKQLGSVPFLKAIDIAWVTGASLAFVKKHGEPAEGWCVSQLEASQKWDADQLDALTLIALSYAEDGTVSPKLVYNTMIAGNPLSVIARLTGAPLGALREAVHATR